MVAQLLFAGFSGTCDMYMQTERSMLAGNGAPPFKFAMPPGPSPNAHKPRPQPALQWRDGSKAAAKDDMFACMDTKGGAGDFPYLRFPCPCRGAYLPARCAFTW